eukprot:1000-Heterococcus_DN1.PRE.2
MSLNAAVVCIRSYVCGDVQLVTLIGDRLRSFIPESSVTAATSSQQHSMLSGSRISSSNTANTSAAQHTASTTSVHDTVCSGSGIQGSVSNPCKHSAVLAGLAMSVLAVAIDGDSECQQALLQRGGVTHAASILKRFQTESYSIARDALLVLGHLAQCSTVGLQLVLQQQTVAAALHLIEVSTSKSNTTSGVIAATTLNMLRTAHLYPVRGDVLVAAFAALVRLSSAPNGRTQLRQGGGIRAVLKAMQCAERVVLSSFERLPFALIIELSASAVADNVRCNVMSGNAELQLQGALMMQSFVTGDPSKCKLKYARVYAQNIPTEHHTTRAYNNTTHSTMSYILSTAEVVP